MRGKSAERMRAKSEAMIEENREETGQTRQGRSCCLPASLSALGMARGLFARGTLFLITCLLSFAVGDQGHDEERPAWRGGRGSRRVEHFPLDRRCRPGTNGHRVLALLVYLTLTFDADIAASLTCYFCSSLVVALVLSAPLLGV